jgi:hypothetical protein
MSNKDSKETGGHDFERRENSLEEVSTIYTIKICFIMLFYIKTNYWKGSKTSTKWMEARSSYFRSIFPVMLQQLESIHGD